MGYKLLFEDCFETDGLPNEKFWNIEKGGHGFGNQEDQYYTRRLKNVYVKDHILNITAYKETYYHRHYTSAKLTTQNKQFIRYGRVEVMASLPKGEGTWPAIWFLGDNIKTAGWPLCGEIDLMEHVGKNPESIHFSLHSEGKNHHIGNQPTAFFKIPGILEGFHEYRMDWDETSISFYLDGMHYVTFTKDQQDDEINWPFDQGFYLILNLAIGGTWGGQIDDTIFPVSMKFKYVKVYERSE
jgi:beta-glucanase (GH16 family)